MTIQIERRMIVKGWKFENGCRKDFVSSSHYTSSGLEFERRRIGELLPNWQPHITEVTVEERYVTPWQVLDL